jgi:hypothetical protein
LVTGEKLGQFAAADNQSGELEIGDATYTTAIVPQKEDPAAMTEPEAKYRLCKRERLAH